MYLCNNFKERWEKIRMWNKKLRAMKKATGKTAKQISEEAGVPISTVENLFSGFTKNPYYEPLKKVVNCMGYTLDDLDGEQNIKMLITSAEHEKLNNNYSMLNDLGKKKLADYSDDLINSGKYKNPDTKEEPADGNEILNQINDTEE